MIEAVGTIEYAPPEQYPESGGRSDIYSLGATTYYLLAGWLPPRSVDRMMPLSISVTKKLPSSREFNLTVSTRLEEVIAKALEIDPDDRFQTANQMREASARPAASFFCPFSFAGILTVNTGREPSYELADLVGSASRDSP